MKTPQWKMNLIKGYQEFRADNYKRQKDLYSELGTSGQSPDIMIIACSDSRADPSDIFNTYPGEIFVMRNVANIVPPFQEDTSYHGSSSAIEFAVKHLKVKAIVVMGHADCGGVKAYMSGATADDEGFSFIGDWIEILDGAKNRLGVENRCDIDNHIEMELAGVLQSVENLLSFPFVKEAVEAGELSLLGSYFSIEQGKLLFANEDGSFGEVPARAG